MRFIGSKRLLLPNIENIIRDNIDNWDKLESFCDIFGGTGCVGLHFKKYFKIISNDLLFFSYIIQKSTIELNHTTLLGCTAQALTVEWRKLHLRGNLQEHHTRTLIKCYLNNNFTMINGMNPFLVNSKHKLLVFNQMHHAWQKMVEVGKGGATSPLPPTSPLHIRRFAKSLKENMAAG